MFKGSLVALVTPMQVDGAIDKKSLNQLIEWHIDAKTNALIIAGTTGEGATLTTDEHHDLIAHAVKQAAKRIPIVAGTGSNSTQHTIELTQNAKKAGADAALIVTPYYNKPTQNGLFEHYKTVAEKVSLPILLYNVPSRTACDLLAETVERLTVIPNIIGIKEASTPERITEILRRCGKRLVVFDGNDATAFDSILRGASGVISVTGNIAASKMHAFCEAALSGNKQLAEKLNSELMILHKKLFVESNPIPAKWALCEMGLIPSGIRLPLLPLDPKYHAEVKKALSEAGII